MFPSDAKEPISVHPARETWQSFVDGCLPDADAAALEDHLRDCTTCQAVVAQCEASVDPFLRMVRAATGGEDRDGLADRANPHAALRREPPGHQAATANVLSADQPLTPPDLDGSGNRIGPYKLLQQIGEGGMGVIYMAEQERPVRRKVAVKIIKPGMDSKQVIARFEAERQALAMMDHINIAKVLDVGSTDAGRPYFVMELVRGVPVTAYCDSNKLTIRERLELFVQVCRAIQHAHQKGVIHRDVKPTNVLVCLYDGRPVPKIIDFGVAKAVDQRLTERTMFTQFGAIIGTLEYMAPEQAEMSQLDVDTRSDIYSLGVLLYELLTGTTPIDRKRLGATPFTELLRAIRDEEPETPSTRLSKSGEALPVISARRGVEPKRLGAVLRGDLDWIVMKALEKDRTRRYETANALARDVERYLNEEPIEARPPSTAYRLRKLARKNRAWLAAAVSFVLLLFSAAVVSVNFGVLARMRARDADRARQTAESREREAIAARDATHRQRERADAMRAEADSARELAETERDNTVRLAYFVAMNQATQQARAEPRAAAVTRIVDHWRAAPMRTDPRGWEWHLLNAPLRNETLVLHGHTVDCRSVAWSPGGRYLASAGFNDAVRVWDSESGHELAAFPAGSVVVVRWSPDGRYIAAGNAAGEIVVIEPAVSTPTRRVQPASSENPPKSFAWSPDSRRLAYGIGNTIEVRDIETLDLVASASQESHQWIQLIRWRTDGEFLATASGSAIRIWDASLRPVRALAGHAAIIVALQWAAAHEQELWSAAIDGSITAWDVSTATARRNAVCRDVFAAAADWNPDGTAVAFYNNDRVTVADTITGERVAEWPTLRMAFAGPFYEQVDWSDDGRKLSLSISGWDAPVPCWDVATIKYTHGSTPAISRSVEKQATRRLDWSRDGKHLVSVDSELVLWDANRGLPIRALDSSIDTPREARFSPDGRFLATAGIGGVRLLRVDDGSVLWHAEPDDFTYSLSWSADGHRLATSPWHPGRVRLWEAATGQELDKELGLSMMMSEIDFAGSGSHFAVSNKYQIEVRDARSGEHIWAVPTEVYARNCMRWSRDGRRLAFSSDQGLIRIVTPNTSFSLRLEGHSHLVRMLDWSWDDQRLASLDEMGTMKIWDVSRGQEILSLANQSSIAWDPTGPRLACSTPDGQITMLDARASYERELPPEYLPVLERRQLVAPDDPDPPARSAVALARAGQWDRAADVYHARKAPSVDRSVFQPGWWTVRGADAATLRADFATPPSPSAKAFSTPSMARLHSPNQVSHWLAARWYCPLDPANGHVPVTAPHLVYLSPVHVRHETDVALVIGINSIESLGLNGAAIYPATVDVNLDRNRTHALATLHAGWNTLVAVGPSRLDRDRFASFSVRVSVDPADLALAYAAAGFAEKSMAAIAAARASTPDDPRIPRAMKALQARAEHQ